MGPKETINSIRINIDEFVQYVYEKLPYSYKADDYNLGSPFKRYLLSLFGLYLDDDGKDLTENFTGISYLIDKANRVVDNVYPMTVPNSPTELEDAILQALFTSWGATYDRNVNFELNSAGEKVSSTTFNRRLLSHIGKLTGYRGTETTIKYLFNLLTHHDIDTLYHREYNNDGVCIGRFLDIYIDVKSGEDLHTVVPFYNEVMKDFVTEYLPFYIRPYIAYKYPTVEITDTLYIGSAVAETVEQILPDAVN